jgi:hypothetical protein
MVHVGAVAALFLLNVYVCRELAGIEFLDEPGSIEPAYIGLARYIRENWRDLTWFPLWYGGIPFQNAYPPLLHVLTAAVCWLPAGQAYHAVTAVLYALGAVTFYWLAVRLSGSAVSSFAAAMLFSTWSPSAMVIGRIWTDVGFPAGRRLQAMVDWGDGPHVASLTAVPVALVLLEMAIERGGRWKLAAGAAMAAVALTNWIGALTLAVAVVCYTMAAGGWRRAAVCGVLGYALAAPWIPPSTVMTVHENARVIGGDYQVAYARLPVVAVVALIAVFAMDRLMRRWGLRMQLRFAVLFAAAMAAITLLAEWRGVSLVPQAERYHLAMEMGICLLAAFAMRGRMVAAGVAVACVAAVIPMRAHIDARPVDVRKTAFARLPLWLESQGIEGRVLLPGAMSWYLAAFSDTPQLEGGFSQGLTNPMIRNAWYAIISDPDPRRCVLWLKALGVAAVGVSGEGSIEPYHPFRHPAKFEGVLDVMWRDGPDVLYRVPQRPASLARVVREADLVTAQVNLLPYVAALEDGALPEASFAWLTRHSARIDAVLKPDHVVSVQISHHAGWRAWVNGRAAEVHKDGLGQMWIRPGCEGRCEIELEFDGGREMVVARWLPYLTLAFGMAASSARSRRPV